MSHGVIHLLRNLGVGGLQSLALDLVRHSPDGFRHHVAVLSEQADLMPEFLALGATVDVLPYRRHHYRQIRDRFLSIARDRSVQTVVSWFYPFVYHLYDPLYRYVAHIGTAYQRVPLVPYLKTALLIATHRRCELVRVFVSDYARSQHQRLFGVGLDGPVIHNAVDLARFTRQRSRGADGRFVVSMVGRMDGSKDFAALVSLAPALGQRIRGCEIWLVGDGAERPRLEVQAADMDNVKFLGRRRDISQILSDTDCFVFLNRSVEGFGIAVAEAMACECPVVTYRMGAMPEIISSGLDGLLVEGVREVLEGICLIHADPERAHAMGVRARATIARSFNVESVARAYGRLYVP